jgi:PAS domain S-box-containing protein
MTRNLVTAFGRTSERGRVDDAREFVDRMSEAEGIGRFGVWRWEISSGRVRWSDELHHIYGLRPGEFTGTVEGFLAHLHPADRERVWSDIQRAVGRLEPFVFEKRILRQDGKERVLLSQGQVVAGSDGAAKTVVGVCHDVTDRVEAEHVLGLSEHRMRAIIDNTPSIVAVKDLEGRYLMTNAECGRILGVSPDELVGRECVELFPDIGDQLRANDRKAAAEGEAVYDEAVLMRDGEPRTYALVTFVLPDDAGLPVATCTIGTDVTERSERESERRERITWQHRIDSALADGRMLVYGQPVINVLTGERRWSELLVRMRSHDDDEGVLQPAAFLPAAERFGLIQGIDVWMVRQALRLAPALAPEVNLSAVTLCDPAARHEIVALLEAQPAAARSIVFEITETAVAEHLDAACEFAAELTALGCGLALDDFGTGFGSFTYLRMLPLRYLKIDRSFVVELVRSRDDRRVVQSIIGIAEQFGLRTIAEGVEDEPTLDLLRELGADYAQGFYTGHPASLRSPA